MVAPVEVVRDILVPGEPTEALYISQHAGLVVTATVFRDSRLDPFYRENLYWFDMFGTIRGIHPMIGEGPHSITATPLHTAEAQPSSADGGDLTDGKQQRWHVFFADGFGAICCIRLDVDDPSLY